MVHEEREGPPRNFIARNDAFVCASCGEDVQPLASGTCRDHCPRCLWGLHVDRDVPGDRASLCRGPLEPIGLSRAGSVIEYRCSSCGVRRRNVAAPDDDGERLMTLSTRPVPATAQRRR